MLNSQEWLCKVSNMKICFLAPANSIHTQRWTEYFDKKGHEIHLISFHFAEIQGVHVHYLAAPLKPFYLLHIPRIKSLLKKIKPDILHAHYASSYGFVAAALDFHPFVVSVWGSDITTFSKKSLIHRHLIKYVLKKADRVTVTSWFLHSMVMNLVPVNEKISVIPFGIETKKFKPRSEYSYDRETIIGSTKALFPQYGTEYLIKAFSLVESKYGDVRLVLIGGGSLRDSLRKLTGKLKISEKVDFIDQVPHFEIPDYLRKIDIFVVPSIKESFGVAALEASACEIPVIASNTGGLPEVVLHNKTGFLVPPKDHRSLAAAIAELIENPSLRKKFGEEGRKFVSRSYDWVENSQSMDQLYHDLLEE